MLLAQGTEIIEDLSVFTGAPVILGIFVDMEKSIRYAIIYDIPNRVFPAVTIHSGQVTTNFDAEPPKQ
jgi:hypothetical protein